MTAEARGEVLIVDDHENARLFAEQIADIEGIVIDPADVETNIVFFEVEPRLGNASQLATALLQNGVRIGASGSQRLRACTHLDVGRDDVMAAARAIGECVRAGFGQMAGTATGPYARG